jgi:hypothetical protein
MGVKNEQEEERMPGAVGGGIEEIAGGGVTAEK